MLARALILLLLVLNLGVASWWLLRSDVTAQTAIYPLPVAPTLRLVGEIPQRARAFTPAAEPTPIAMSPVAAAPAPTEHCVTLGPFSDAAALARATALLRPMVGKLQMRQVATAGRGWRVRMPPLPDREAAQAMAARIAAAGFSDYYVVSDGVEANSIALGRYGNQDTAQRRQAALQAAGFTAQAEALGQLLSWIDVTSNSPLDGDSVRSQVGAPQARLLDCASLR